MCALPVWSQNLPLTGDAAQNSVQKSFAGQKSDSSKSDSKPGDSKSDAQGLQTRVPVLEQEPPEEDPDLKTTEYSFNPLEATKHITAGNFYYKKGNYRAANKRYLEATKWDPTSADALLKLGESDEKMRDFPGARDAYTRYLALGPDAKAADAIKKKMAKLPEPRKSKASDQTNHVTNNGTNTDKRSVAPNKTTAEPDAATQTVNK